MRFGFLKILTIFVVFLWIAVSTLASNAQGADSAFWDTDISTKNIINGFDDFHNSMHVSDIDSRYGKNFSQLVYLKLKDHFNQEEIRRLNVGVDYSKNQIVVYQRENNFFKLIMTIAVAPATLTQIQNLSAIQNVQNQNEIKRQQLKKNVEQIFDNGATSKSIGDKIIPGVQIYSTKLSGYSPFQPKGTQEKNIGASMRANQDSSLFFEASQSDDTLFPQFQMQSATIGMINQINPNITTKFQYTKIQSPIGTIPEDTVIMGTITIKIKN